jgi:hypothetical protein
MRLMGQSSWAASLGIWFLLAEFCLGCQTVKPSGEFAQPSPLPKSIEGNEPAERRQERPAAKICGSIRGEAEAIALGETFVKVNGYVRREDAVPGRLMRESCCTDGGSEEAVLLRRQGTLLPDACGISDLHQNGTCGWIVVFCYDPHRFRFGERRVETVKFLRTTGRPVVVLDDQVWPKNVGHQDFNLRSSRTKALPGLDVLEQVIAEFDKALPGVE